MRGRSRVDDQSLCIPDVRQHARQFERVDALRPGFQTALHAKAQHGTVATFTEVLPRGFVRRVGFQRRVRHPRDTFVSFQILGQPDVYACR